MIVSREWALRRFTDWTANDTTLDLVIALILAG